MSEDVIRFVVGAAILTPLVVMGWVAMVMLVCIAVRDIKDMFKREPE